MNGSAVKRRLVGSGLAVTAAVAPMAVGVTPNASVGYVADPCPTDEVTQIYFDGCLPSLNPPPHQVDLRGPNQLAEIRGIPCDGTNTGTCIGLGRLPGGTPAQPDAVAPQPDTEVRSSP